MQAIARIAPFRLQPCFRHLVVLPVFVWLARPACAGSTPVLISDSYPQAQLSNCASPQLADALALEAWLGRWPTRYSDFQAPSPATASLK